MMYKFAKIATATVVSGAITVNLINRNRVHLESVRDVDITYQEYGGDNLKNINAFKFGVPARSRNVDIYKNHALCYNYEKRIPHWVMELLTKDTMKGAANREKLNFVMDPNVPFMFASKNEDYSKSGWSRGHMAAAGNHKHDQDAMSQTFYLTNIVPQDIDNNCGFWNMVEIYSRDLVNKFGNVWVITGPLFMPQTEGGKKFVKYEVLGKNEVAVPTHLFKILLTDDGNKKLLGAFVVPNKPIPTDGTLKEHQVSMEYIEARAGFQFFPTLDRTSVGDLCKTEGCALRSRVEFERYIMKKKLESARTTHRLEKIWNEISQKGVKQDHEMTTIYNNKKEKSTDCDSALIPLLCVHG